MNNVEPPVESDELQLAYRDLTETRVLLAEALEFLNDRPSFGLRRDPRKTRYRLAAKIDAYFSDYPK